MLGHDEDEAIEFRQSGLPGQSVRVRRRYELVRHAVVEHRQVEVTEVDDLGSQVGATGRLLHQPCGGLVGEAFGACRSDDECDVWGRTHVGLLFELNARRVKGGTGRLLV